MEGYRGQMTSPSEPYPESHKIKIYYTVSSMKITLFLEFMLSFQHLAIKNQHMYTYLLRFCIHHTPYS